MVIGEMSKCSFKSPCGKLVGVVHGDDILLSGPRSLVDAVRNSLRKHYEIREQMLGAGPKDASEIIMLNRRVQWTEAGIRISPDPRHVKDIIEELGLCGSQTCRHANDRESVKQEGQRLPCPEHAGCHTVQETCGKVELLGNGSTRYSLRCMGSQASSPKDADMVRLKRVGRFLIGRPITWTHYRWGGCDQTESWHTRTVIGQQTAKTGVQ